MPASPCHLILTLAVSLMSASAWSQTPPNPASSSTGLHSVLYADQFPGSDIGAQINNAYAAMVAGPGSGKIIVEPQVGGGCYRFSTPILFTTAQKYVILEGSAPSTSNNSSPGGSCLFYTPTTGTAITMDITPSNGGGNAVGAGMRDITLVNAQGFCNGGCKGTSAIGVSTGLHGVQGAFFENVRVIGFYRGFTITDSIGWGIMWLNSSVVWNNTGIYFDPPINHELDKFIGGIINTNGNGIEFAHPGELSIEAASIDLNTTCGVTIDAGPPPHYPNPAQLHIFGVHWENTGGSSLPRYVCGGPTTNSEIDITGGLAIDASKSSTPNTVPWFLAGIVSAKGILLSSAGRRTTGGIFSANTRVAGVDIINQNQGPLSPLVANARVAVFTQAGDGAYVPELNSPKFVYPETAVPSDISVAGSDKCYGDSTAHMPLCNYNGGTNPHPLRTIETGTCKLNGASPATCTVTWARAFNATPLCFVSWNGTGTLTGILKAVPSPATCVITDSVDGDNGVLQVEGVAAPN